LINKPDALQVLFPGGHRVETISYCSYTEQNLTRARTIVNLTCTLLFWVRTGAALSKAPSFTPYIFPHFPVKRKKNRESKQGSAICELCYMNIHLFTLAMILRNFRVNARTGWSTRRMECANTLIYYFSGCWYRSHGQ
jgi:hypothetical protein